MRSRSAALESPPSKFWIAGAVLLLAVFGVVLTPASVAVPKLLPDSARLVAASGNLLSGSATVLGRQNTPATLEWKLKPADLLLLRLGLSLQLRFGESSLSTDLSRSALSTKFKELNASLTPTDLTPYLGGFAFSGSPIHVTNAEVVYTGEFTHATGGFDFAGGQFQSGATTARIKPLQGGLSVQNNEDLALEAVNTEGADALSVKLSSEGRLSVAVLASAYELEAAGQRPAPVTYAMQLWAAS